MMKSFEEREGIYKSSLSKWGMNSTLLLLIKETAELISVVIKQLRNHDDTALIVRKMAAVENLFGHIKCYYNLWETVENQKDNYLDEVAARIKGDKNAG